MKLTCPACRHVLLIDDARVPAAQFKVKCPSCSQPIIGKGPAAETPPASPSASEAAPTSADWERMKPFVEDYVNLRMAELRQEMQALRAETPPAAHTSSAGETHQLSTIRRALICEADPKISQAVAGSLGRMGYQFEAVKGSREALKKMREQHYDLIATGSRFADDPAGGNKILSMVNAKKFDERSKTFVVLLSSDLDTVGPENAFLHGANLTVNVRDLNVLERLISQAQLEFQKLSG